MAFQIRNGEGKPIHMNDLNIEAAKFWGQTDTSDHVSPVKIPDGLFDSNRSAYTDLIKRHCLLNWYDRIGGSIHGVKATTWDEVINEMIRPFVEHGYTVEETKADEEYNKPLIDLVLHWEGKGYTPHFIKD